MQPFRANGDASSKITVAATSGRVAIAGNPQCVRVCNPGTATAWIKFGPSDVTADMTNDMPIPGNGFTEVHYTNNIVSDGSQLYVAAIAVGSTGDIWFTPGSGN